METQSSLQRLNINADLIDLSPSQVRELVSHFDLTFSKVQVLLDTTFWQWRKDGKVFPNKTIVCKCLLLLGHCARLCCPETYHE